VLLVRYIIGGVLSFLTTFYLVPLFIKVALKFSIVDMPDGKLKKHIRPTPYLGGLAVFVGFLVPGALVLPFEHHFVLFIFASTLLLFIGLLDDLVVLTPLQKIFGQFIAVLCYLRAGFYVKELFFSNTWNVALSLLWFVVCINAFNLIDVMDGLATSVALCITCSFLLFSVVSGNATLALLLCCLLGAIGAFFVFNKPPAQIYLGDAGSLFLGGFLAAIPFGVSWSEYGMHGYFAPLLIMALPLVEISTLILVRTFKRVPFYHGSPDHFAILLRQKGWSVYQILVYCFVLSVLLLLLSLLFFYGLASLACGLMVCTLLLLVWFLLLI
jgi:UDP-GlcNAc:undecaprenyl-phosphate/decaprenyl-phosphate GlcNAc-1-phosphate transferase